MIKYYFNKLGIYISVIQSLVLLFPFFVLLIITINKKLLLPPILSLLKENKLYLEEVTEMV